MSLVWINGHLVDKADAKVSPFDHGFLYGDGVWQPIRVFGSKPFRPGDQVSRLFNEASSLEIEISLSPAELIAAIEETVLANSRKEGYVRVIVTRGPGTIGPDPRKLISQIFILAEEYQPFPPDLYAHGLHVVGSHPGIPILGLSRLFRLLAQRHIIKAKMDALSKGCLEAVLLDDNSRVCGCTEGHLFRVVDGVVRQVSYYPPDVAQLVVKEQGDMIGIRFATTIEEMDSSPTIGHLLEAEEVFLAGTSCGVIAVVRIDGREIGGGTEGPITRQLRERYLAVTRGGG